MVMMMLISLACKNFLQKFCLKIMVALKGIKNLLAIKLSKRSCYNSSLGIVLSDKLNSSLDFSCISLISSCKNDCSGILDLIDKELTKVLDVYLSL